MPPYPHPRPAAPTALPHKTFLSWQYNRANDKLPSSRAAMHARLIQCFSYSAARIQQQPNCVQVLNVIDCHQLRDERQRQREIYLYRGL